jgi:hypothetical protein
VAFDHSLATSAVDHAIAPRLTIVTIIVGLRVTVILALRRSRCARNSGRSDKRQGSNAADNQTSEIDVCETAVDDEIAFLRTEIYMRDVDPGVQRLTAFTRFSCRG